MASLLVSMYTSRGQTGTRHRTHRAAEQPRPRSIRVRSLNSLSNGIQQIVSQD